MKLLGIDILGANSQGICKLRGSLVEIVERERKVMIWVEQNETFLN